MALEFLKGLFTKTKPITPSAKEVTNDRIAGLREERANLIKRLSTFKMQLDEADKTVSSFDNRPLSEQRRAAKMEIISAEKKRRMIKQRLGTDSLKFAVLRYNKLTNDRNAAAMLNEFLDDPLKNAGRLGLAEALADVCDKIEKGTLPLRDIEKDEVLVLLKKLNKNYLDRLKLADEVLNKQVRKNTEVLSVANPLERASLKKQALKQEVRNVENELELIGERLRKESDKRA